MSTPRMALFEALPETGGADRPPGWEAAAPLATGAATGPHPAVGTPLPRATPGLTSYVATARQYGLPETIRALQAVGAAWQRAHPRGPRIGIGDISARGGGPLRPHKSHQRGVDVDIRPVRGDGREGPTRFQDAATYSRALTQELVNLLRANGVLRVQYVFFNDPRVTGVRPQAGHDNHLHVRFFPPGAAGAPSPATGGAAVPRPGAGQDERVLRAALAGGLRDENRLTDRLFHARHPERRGRRLARGERAAIGEWLAIRNRIVRPALARAASPAPAPPTAGPAPGAGALPAGPFGTLVVAGPGGTTWRYTFTPEDALWTARFLTGEAGGRDDPDNRAVLWTMFNRYALFTRRVPAFDQFHKFLRAYSTPLQPVLRSPGAARRHMDRPGFVRTGGFYDPPNQMVPRGQTARHLQIQRLPWGALPAGARALAAGALRGEIANPGIGNATEFANTATYFKDQHGKLPTVDQWRAFTVAFARSKRRGKHPGWTWIGDVPRLRQYSVNTFFVDNRVGDLPAGAVRVVPPGQAPG